MATIPYGPTGAEHGTGESDKPAAQHIERIVNTEVDARPRNKNREKPRSVTAPYKRPFER